MKSSEKTTLASIVLITKGRKHSVVDTASPASTRMIGIDDLRNDDCIRFTDDKTGTDVVTDDILIAWDGANAGTIGFGKTGLIGSTIARLRTKEKDKFFAPFLGTFLQSKFSYLRQTATGATIPHINRKALESIILPDIELDDQKRIAHLLGKVEGLIARRKQHLQQLDDLLKSFFLEMFGDPVQNEKGWGTKTLPQLILPGKHSLKRGPFGGTLKKEIFVDSGYLVYEQNHALNNDYSFGRYFITEKKYNELIDFRVLPKDILISCSGVYLGKLSIVPEGARPGIINQALLKVSLNPEKIKHIFFVYVFASPQFKNKYFPSNRGGAIPNLPPMIEMKKIPFISPPIELQEEFAAIVEKAECLKSRYQQSLTDLEDLYGVLSQKAFKGELDLSRVPLPTEGPEIAEEAKSDTDDKQPMEPLFELPEPKELAVLLQSAEGRKVLLGQWLTSWLEQLGNSPFEAQSFMEAARQWLWGSAEDAAPDWGVAEYDELKAWVFEALAQGRLTQGYEDANNRVQVKTTKG